MNADQLTKWVQSGLNLLLLKYPTRTSIALLIGPATDFVIDLFRPVLSNIAWLNLQAITPIRVSIFAVVVVHAPLLFVSYRMPEAVEGKFAAVGRAVKEGNMSAAQARQLYHKIAMDAVAEARMSRRGGSDPASASGA